VSTYSHGCQSVWIKAVREIYTGLVQTGFNVAVEIIDALAFFKRLPVAPILSTDRALIEGWNRVLPSFLAIIDKQSWVAIDVLYRELPSHGMQPTVIINASDANDDSWDSILPALFQLLQDNHVELNVVVLFLRDLNLTGANCSVSHAGDTEDFAPPHHSIRERFCEDEVQMGTSCGIAGSSGAGTLGGRLKLQKGTSVLDLGLTNYHVLKNAFTDEGPSAGLFPPQSEQLYGAVNSPSDLDYKAEIRTLQEDVAKYKERLKDISKQLELLTEEDPRWDSKLNMKSLWQAHLNASELVLRVAESYSCYLGHVYAASGFQTCINQRYLELPEHRNWASDWCLVQLDPLKPISCMVGDVSSDALFPYGTEVTRYCSISKDENYRVLKRGRTTGWTTGTLSAIDSVIRSRDQHPPELPTTQELRAGEKWDQNAVRVHTIIGSEKRPQFLEPGDSGSLVLLKEHSDSQGALVIGLGFAANAACQASYIIPMDLLVEDTERATEAKVIEPQYAGMANVSGR
jgi:hypothetical protein